MHRWGGVLLEIRMLGPLQVLRDGEPIPVRGKRRFALLAGLILSPDMAASRDRLVDAVWGDTPPKDPPHALESLVSQLRGTLGAPRSVIASGDGYALNRDDVDVDISRFRRLVAEGARAADGAHPEEASRLFTEALGLWRGRVLDGIDVPASLVPPVTELEELRQGALESRLQAELDLGHHDRVVGELRALTRANPLRERLWGMLMVALYRSGRQTEALRAYQEAREHLGEVVGIEPGPELRDLEERILLQDASIAAAPRPRTRMHNLPEYRSPFIGRVDEVKAVSKLFDRSQLVTLVGPGGVGKTRLAVEVARQLIGDAREARFVDLTQVDRAADVAATIGVALGLVEPSHDDVPHTGVEIEALIVSFVASREPLIVMDNCEQVIDEAARLAGLLIGAGEGVRVLTTSREALRVDGEHVWETPPLALPPAEDARGDTDAAASDAVRLFVDRASAASATFELTADNAGDVASLCRRLEGMALAIELAAAQVRVFGLPEILERLDRQLTLLAGGLRSADTRHQSLRAAIAWSYRLLTDEEQRMLVGLAVFPGTFDLDAVELLFADEHVDATFGELVRKSLVLAQAGPGGRRRYRLLESVREFAWEGMRSAGDMEALAARHAMVFLHRAERAWEQSEDLQRRRVAERLMLDMANLRAALAWFRDHDAGRLLQMCGALGWFWEHHLMGAEAEEWSEDALAATDADDSPTRARALVAAVGGLLGARLGRREQALERGREALAMYRRLGDELGEARTGLVLCRLGFIEEGLPKARICELYRRHGSRWGYASALLHYAYAEQFGDPELAYQLAAEATDIFSELGDEASWAQATLRRGWLVINGSVTANIEDEVQRALGIIDRTGGATVSEAALFRSAVARDDQDWESAERHAIRALESSGEHVSMQASVGVVAGDLAWIKLERGDLAGAVWYLRMAAEGYDRHDDIHGTVHIVESLVSIVADMGAHALGARLHGAAHAFRSYMAAGPFRESGYDMPEWDVPRYEEALAVIRKGLTEKQFDTAVAEGSGWTLDEALEAALSNVLTPTEA